MLNNLQNELFHIQILKNKSRNIVYRFFNILLSREPNFINRTTLSKIT